MRFKVGDKVRVRTDLRTGPTVTSHHLKLTGNKLTIDSASRSGIYTTKETGEVLFWTEEMLSPITDPLVAKILERNNKQNVADEIIKLKEQGKSWSEISEQVNKKTHDPIKPAHYRKGEIDLYESWYRTYPFNEFRAGMQMIAERYMKRDKNDRIEDMDKAMETLRRLKEYEEKENAKD